MREPGPFFADAVKLLKSRLEEADAPRLLLLQGPLGAGKTTLVKELLAAWGHDPAQVQSPTFLKLLEHRVPGLGLVLHLDAYRIEAAEDVARLSLESYEEARLVLVEWPERVLEYLKSSPARTRVLGLDRALLVEIAMGAQALSPRKLQLSSMKIVDC